MREKIGAILATATVFSACEASAQEPAEWKPPIVYADQLPDTIPEAVARQIPNTAAITNEIHGYIDTWHGYTSQYACSGVRIDEYEYLSAGHCVDPRNLPPEVEPACQEVSIDISIDNNRGTTLKGRREAGYAADPTTINQPGFLAKKDVLLLHVDENTPPNQLPYDEPTKLYDHAQRITQGTPLYFVNYQPTDTGEVRNPNENSKSIADRKLASTTPAIIGGIAIRYVYADTIEVITIEKNYSEPVESLPRQGGSGGPVYDEQGNLVATLTAINENLISLQQYESFHAIDIVGLPDDTQITASYIKTVTQEAIDGLRMDLITIPHCE